jgi:hypothetical protein
MSTPRFVTGRRFAPAWATLLLAISLPQVAPAGTTFDLGNTAILGVTGLGATQLAAPYATLDILGDTSTGTLSFTLSTSPHNAAPPIDSVFNDISFNTPLTLGVDFTLLSASNGGTIGPGGNVSSFGTFKYTVGGNGSAARDQPYTFTLQLTDPSQALASNFQVANGSGNLFAAHLYTDIGSGVTGFIAAGSIGPAAVPEPSAIVMTIGPLALLGTAALRRARRCRTSVDS